MPENGDPRQLVQDIIRGLVGEAEMQVEAVEEDGETVLEVTVPEQSMGKVIGKQGRTVKAMRAIMAAVSEKKNRRYTLEILE